MTKWITDIPFDAEKARIKAINAHDSPLKGAVTERPVELGSVMAPILAKFSRPLTDTERESLKTAIIALVDRAVEPGLLQDFEIEAGVTASEKIEGREWGFTLSWHMRTEEVRNESETPPEK